MISEVVSVVSIKVEFVALWLLVDWYVSTNVP